MIIKKKEALAVLNKFNMPPAGKKERLAKFYYQGERILTTAVPKGRGDMICTDKFRSQLHLSPEQLRKAVACPFRIDDFILKLREKGYISSNL
ncbi:hypothetical protein ACFL1I_08560 [Candidatus Omnitrophota bacterium]